MQIESRVPEESRVLLLAMRLSADRFDAEKQKVIAWCAANDAKLTDEARRALATLQSFELHERVAAIVVHHCYADIPRGRTYTAAFDLSRDDVLEHTVATLLFGTLMSRWPLESLEHGHHQLAVFDFPGGTPALIAALPVFDPGVSCPRASVGLCDASSLAAIRRRRRDIASTE